MGFYSNLAMHYNISPRRALLSLSSSVLRCRNISFNPLLNIHPSHFNHLIHLQSLWVHTLKETACCSPCGGEECFVFCRALEGMEIPDIQANMFLPMKNLSHMYVLYYTSMTIITLITHHWITKHDVSSSVYLNSMCHCLSNAVFLPCFICYHLLFLFPPFLYQLL